MKHEQISTHAAYNRKNKKKCSTDFRKCPLVLIQNPWENDQISVIVCDVKAREDDLPASGTTNNAATALMADLFSSSCFSNSCFTELAFTLVVQVALRGSTKRSNPEISTQPLYWLSLGYKITNCVHQTHSYVSFEVGNWLITERFSPQN